MRNLNQARARIWESIAEHGGATEVAKSAGGAVSASMLFKFRSEDGPKLGKDSVNALSPILTDIDAETWLAAMGIERAAEAVVEASA